MTGSNWLNWKTQAIVQAIGEAGRPLKNSEIAKLTGLHHTTVGRYINWNMVNVWVKVMMEEKARNGQTIKYYGLTPRGYAKLEAMA